MDGSMTISTAATLRVTEATAIMIMMKMTTTTEVTMTVTVRIAKHDAS